MKRRLYVFETTPNKVSVSAQIPLAVVRLLTHEWSCRKERPIADSLQQNDPAVPPARCPRWPHLWSQPAPAEVADVTNSARISPSQACAPERPRGQLNLRPKIPLARGGFRPTKAVAQRWSAEPSHPFHIRAQVILLTLNSPARRGVPLNANWPRIQLTTASETCIGEHVLAAR